MKKLLVCLLVTVAFMAKPSSASAQLGYEQGYNDGFAFAVERCGIAVEQHPEWALTLTPYQWHLGLTTVFGYSLAYNDYQAAMLAVNYVHASYYSGIIANKDVNAYYNGYYFGYLDGTAAVVIDL